MRTLAIGMLFVSMGSIVSAPPPAPPKKTEKEGDKALNAFLNAARSPELREQHKKFGDEMEKSLPVFFECQVLVGETKNKDREFPHTIHVVELQLRKLAEFEKANADSDTTYAGALKKFQQAYSGALKHLEAKEKILQVTPQKGDTFGERLMAIEAMETLAKTLLDALKKGKAD
jgi:hypothetical protein